MKKALLVVFTFFLLFTDALAYEVTLNVPWVCQLDVKNGLGTDWDKSMNCGPAALVMSAAYLMEFRPTTIHIKKVDDWLVRNGLVEDVSHYNLPEPGTGQSELRKAAGGLFGLSTTRFYSTKFWGVDKEIQLRCIAYSLLMDYPVIVGVKSRMDPSGQHHWMVVTGLRDLDMDGRFDEVRVNDPGMEMEVNYGKRWYSVSQLRSVWWGSIYFLDVNAPRFVDSVPVSPGESEFGGLLRGLPRFTGLWGSRENPFSPKTRSGSAPMPISDELY